MKMKTQDLLLVALVGAGLWFLTRKKPKVAKKSSEEESGGGGGVGGGTMPVGVETSEIDVSINEGASDSPSMIDCVKNPDLYGCESVLPQLATQDGKEQALGELAGSESGTDLLGGDSVALGMGSGGGLGTGGHTGGHGGGDVETGLDVLPDDRGGTTTTRDDIKTPAVSDVRGRGTAGGKYVATLPVKSPPKKKFTGDRMDVAYKEEMSNERRKGRNDKYDFDGEYGTFMSEF